MVAILFVMSMYLVVACWICCYLKAQLRDDFSFSVVVLRDFVYFYFSVSLFCFEALDISNILSLVSSFVTDFVYNISTEINNYECTYAGHLRIQALWKTHHRFWVRVCDYNLLILWSVKYILSIIQNMLQIYLHSGFWIICFCAFEALTACRMLYEYIFKT